MLPCHIDYNLHVAIIRMNDDIKPVQVCASKYSGNVRSGKGTNINLLGNQDKLFKPPNNLTV